MRAYDALAGFYDRLAAGSEQPLAALGLQLLDARPGERVLDIGCGTGQALPVLARAVAPGGLVCGVDLSRGMLRQARRRAGAGIHCQQADAARLPFAPGSFDVLFLSFALELFDTPEIPALLAGCRRALKPGGRLGVVALAREARENLPQRIYEWCHRRFPAYADCRPIYLRQSLLQAGFEIRTSLRRNMWGLPVDICLAYSFSAGGLGV